MFNYSNLGISLLGGVVEAITKTSYKNYMQKNILEPIGMTESKFTYTFYQDNIFSANIFQGKKFYFTRIENKKTIIMEDKYGNREIVGFKVNQLKLSNTWNKTLGKYSDESGKINISYVLKMQNNYFLYGKKMVVKYFLNLLNL